jgi:magnesium transporter
MLALYAPDGLRLRRLPEGSAATDALWIDLMEPTEAETATVAALGLDVPTLADMEEIELSNRLYRENNCDYMTVVLPGFNGAPGAVSGPVTFILATGRLVTVRHHVPRPFETYPERAGRMTAGCTSAERVFLGLIEDIIARLADHLEAAGRTLDAISRAIYGTAPGKGSAQAGQPRADAILQGALEQLGHEGDLIGRVRLSLLTLERAVSFFGQTDIGTAPDLRPIVKGTMRDIQALEVHADFLSQRLGMASDATMGMINLAQNRTVRIVSVVAVIFLPPTLIASIYGMNFALMPELALDWGYPMAVAMMLASAVGTYLFFKWRRWL